MQEKTLCPVCEELLTVILFPEFLYCEGCEVGVKRIECRQNLSQARADYNSVWAKRHHSDLSAKLTACSITKRIKGIGFSAGCLRHILDIGCGSGLLVDMLTGEGYDSTGLDLSGEVINYARLHSRGKYLCAGVDNIKVKYDMVIMSHILEHLPNPVGYLRKVAHLIKPSGFLLVVVPNLGGYDIGSIWRRESCALLFDHTHVMAFSKRGLNLVLGKAGYQIVWANTETLGASLLNRVVVGVFRRVRGNPTIYKKQEKFRKALPNWSHRIYQAIADSALSRGLCYIPNRLSERRGKGLGLVILATLRGDRTYERDE